MVNGEQGLSSDAAPHDLWSRIQEATDVVRAKLGVEKIDALCVLGSGLGGVVEALESRSSIPTSSIPHVPKSTVEGHEGHLHVGKVAGHSVMMLQGRVHTYEGIPAWQTSMIVRISAKLGAKVVVLTNSAGSTSLELTPGNLMLITDHLNLSGRNPLLGPHDPRLGARFPDMTTAYSPRLQELAKDSARRLGLDLKEGVYAWNLGPSYETPAEVRMAKTMGADAVGMSTAPEAIVARQGGQEILAFSCITNLGAGLSGEALSHDEVQEVAGPATKRLGRLIMEVLSHVFD